MQQKDFKLRAVAPHGVLPVEAFEPAISHATQQIMVLNPLGKPSHFDVRDWVPRVPTIEELYFQICQHVGLKFPSWSSLDVPGPVQRDLRQTASRETAAELESLSIFQLVQALNP